MAAAPPPAGNQPPPLPLGTNHFDDYARLVLALAAMIGLVVLIAAWSIFKTLMPVNMEFFVAGQLFGIVITCYQFWFGSSSGSKLKDLK